VRIAARSHSAHAVAFVIGNAERTPRPCPSASSPTSSRRVAAELGLTDRITAREFLAAKVALPAGS
jgi:hypothetical protein